MVIYEAIWQRLTIVFSTFFHNRNTSFGHTATQRGRKGQTFVPSVVSGSLLLGNIIEAELDFQLPGNTLKGKRQRLPSLLPFLLLPNGWNTDVIAGASAATLSHKNHCSLKPQMRQDRRKLDTMSCHTSSGSHDFLKWQTFILSKALLF